MSDQPTPVDINLVFQILGAPLAAHMVEVAALRIKIAQLEQQNKELMAERVLVPAYTNDTAPVTLDDLTRTAFAGRLNVDPPCIR